MEHNPKKNNEIRIVYVLVRVKIANHEKMYYSEKVLTNWSNSLQVAQKFDTMTEAIIKLKGLIDGAAFYNVEPWFTKDQRRTKTDTELPQDSVNQQWSEVMKILNNPAQ